MISVHKCEKYNLEIPIHEEGYALLDIGGLNMRINYCPKCGKLISLNKKCKKNGTTLIKDKRYRCIDQDHYYIYLEDIDENQICLTYKEYEEFFDNEC